MNCKEPTSTKFKDKTNFRFWLDLLNGLSKQHLKVLLILCFHKRGMTGKYYKMKNPDLPTVFPRCGLDIKVLLDGGGGGGILQQAASPTSFLWSILQLTGFAKLFQTWPGWFKTSRRARHLEITKWLLGSPLCRLLSNSFLCFGIELTEQLRISVWIWIHFWYIQTY